MHVQQFEDPAAFVATTRDFLLADEPRHALLLGIAQTLIDQPQTYPDFRLWVVANGGETAACALMTVPYNAIVSDCADATAQQLLAGAIADTQPQAPGVIGCVPDIDAFTQLWCDHTGQHAVAAMNERLYVATGIDAPGNVGGEMRPASESDRALLMQWVHAFAVEALDDPVEAERSAHRMALRSDIARRWVMWYDGGLPVAMAGYSGYTPHGVRIGPVYTPPERRRRGYAGALTAAISQQLLDSGRDFCCLYTDLANPTSNSIYQAIGYRPHCDARRYAFLERSNR